MKRRLFYCILMMFVAVIPMREASAVDDGIQSVGEYLLYIGEVELKRGRIDAAVSEFSKVLLIEPNNEQALHYLHELGFERGLYEPHNVALRQKVYTQYRMHLIEQEMKRFEEERAALERHYQAMYRHEAGTVQNMGSCPDYYESIDRRAGFVTLCDGTKKMVHGKWHSADTFVKHIGDDWPDHIHEKKRKKKTSMNIHSGHHKKHLHQNEDYEYMPPVRREGYMSDDLSMYEDISEEKEMEMYSIEEDAEEDMMVMDSGDADLMEEGTAEVMAEHSESPVMEKSLTMNEEPQDASLENLDIEQEMTEPVYTEEMAQSDQSLDEINHQLIALEKDYDYENFLKEKYFNSQQQLANSMAMNDLQYLKLVQLHNDLDTAHEKILRLFIQREDAYNRVVHEMDYLRLKGKLE